MLKNNLDKLLKEKPIFSEEELAEAWEITKATLRRYRKQSDNQLKCSKTGTKKIQYFRNHVIDFIVEDMNITKKEKAEVKQQLIQYYNR